MTKEEVTQILKNSTRRLFVLLRGLPGSGKSTFAEFYWNSMGKNGVICSADHYWIQEDGTYKFDLTQVPKNHHYCFRKSIDAMIRHHRAVILDNTNITIKEFSHYVSVAQAYDYKVVVITLNISVETSKARNVHKVPEKTIQSRYANLNHSMVPVSTFCRDNSIDHFIIDNK